MRDYCFVARSLGFTAAALLPVSELVIVPEYRTFCAENLCGCYNALPACPPMCGTVEEMTARVRRCQTALVLMIEFTPADPLDRAEQKAAERYQNELTEQLLARLHADGLADVLMMSVGPWKTFSCMSAYCVDAQKMADAAGMPCWTNDGKAHYFSLLLF